MQIRSLGWDDPLEKEMATHSTVLAWETHGQRSLAGYSPWGHKYMSYVADYTSVQFSHSVVSDSL